MNQVNMFVKILYLLLCWCAITSYAQSVANDYFDRTEVQVTWNASIGQVNPGNGAFMSPSGKVLVVVQKDAIVYAFHPKTGTKLWTYTPADVSISSAHGGVFFSSYKGQDYILYSITSNANFPSETKRYVLCYLFCFSLVAERIEKFIDRILFDCTCKTNYFPCLI